MDESTLPLTGLSPVLNKDVVARLRSYDRFLVTA
jgi:hypothetical protein